MRAPDYFDAPEPDRCKACGAPIDDTTNCTTTIHGEWFCPDCTVTVEAESVYNATGFDADDPRSKPMSMFGGGLFEAFTGRKGR